MNPRIFLFCCALVLPLGAQEKTVPPSPTRSQYQTAATQMFDRLEAYTKVLEGVKDLATAQAAKPAIEKLTKDFKAAVAEAKSLGEPSAAVKKEIEADAAMQQRAVGITKRLVAATQKVSSIPEAVEVLKDPIIAFQKVMQGGSKAAPPADAPKSEVKTKSKP